jgi:hypothetical protein
LFTGDVTGIYFDRGMTELEVEGNRVRLGEIVSINPPNGDADEADSSSEGE